MGLIVLLCCTNKSQHAMDGWQTKIQPLHLLFGTVISNDFDWSATEAASAAYSLLFDAS